MTRICVCGGCTRAATTTAGEREEGHSRLRLLPLFLAAMLLLGAFVTYRVPMNKTPKMPSSSSLPSMLAATPQQTDAPSELFPTPLDMLRRNIPLKEAYDYPDRNFYHNSSCSCLSAKNPGSSGSMPDCCFRGFRRSHKMGFIMTRGFAKSLSFGEYQIQLSGWPYRNFDYSEKSFPGNSKDFRVVLLLRNVYKALISGYLYHKSGMECWLNTMGKPKNPDKGFKQVKVWYEHLSYSLNPPRGNRSLCTYLAEESDEIGMRAYVDYIFHSQWIPTFTIWALSKELPVFQNRTLTVCYADLSSTEEGQISRTVQRMFDFYFPGSSDEFRATVRDSANKMDAAKSSKNQTYQGTHSTSHDPALHEHLEKLIRQIDHKYYNGDIQWLNSVLPCHE